MGEGGERWSPTPEVLVGTVSPVCSLPGHREIHVIDTDYERYAILRLSLHWQGKDFHVLKYFSKLSRRGLACCCPAGPLAQSPLPPQLAAWRTSMSQASGGSGS